MSAGSDVPNDATETGRGAEETLPCDGTAGAPEGGTVLWDPGASAEAGTGPSPQSLPEGPRLGPYELIELLGRGGMGAVYKAWHPGLRTHCALKVLLAGADASEEDVHRFRREAHALARLHHPGIVAVYDVGEEDGRTFLAMEFVPGRTLAGVLAEGREQGMEPRAAVGLLRQMAEALEAAHQAGVLHRDLKPANVLIDAAGRAKLMDFGLAKLEEGEGSVATRTGELIGTPAYMSPEHVERGMTEVDPQSDVYQLGAILYEMLTGRCPYEGSSVTEVMLRVAQQEPVAPRRLRPALDRDAETICLKAMAREKSRRYRSARELALDCARYEAGEAISARRETGRERAVRWARRRKGFTALAAAAAIALAAAVQAGWDTRRADRESGEARRALEEAAEERRRLEAEILAGLRLAARANLTGALLVRRAGGRMHEAEAAFLGPLQEAAARALARAPDLAEPHYHLGRMYRALLRFDDARAAQERALTIDPAHPRARYERGLLLLRAYDAHLRDRRREWLRLRGEEMAQRGGGAIQGGGAAREPTAAEVEDDEARRLREEARHDLLAAAEAAGEIGPAPGQCGRGMLAHLDGNVAAAARALDEAVRLEPDLEEAWEARAHLAFRQEGPDAAAEWFARGLARDRGYVPFLEGRARVRQDAAVRKWQRGVDPFPDFAAAVEDLTRALELAPERADLWEARGSARVNEAYARAERGQDATALFDAAMADLGKSAELRPDRPEVHRSRGLARINQANRMSARGRDPRAQYALAVEDLTRALALDPGDDETWMRRGLARANAGNFAVARGEDPVALYTAALADFEEALRRNPTREETWVKRGIARTNWGAHRIQRGEDPGELYEAALQDFAEAVRLNPSSDESWLKRGNLRINWAAYRLSRGRDATELLDAAVADLGEALARNPRRDETWLRRATAQVNRGYLEQALGRDPAPAYAAAAEDFGRAIELNPARDESWMGRGSARLNLGLYRAGRGESPDDDYRAAIEDFSGALQRNPGRPESWNRRSGAYRSWADALWARGEDPGDRYEQALADGEQAVKVNPRRVDLWKELADARVAAARKGAADGERAGALWRGAVEAYGRALDLQPGEAEALLGRASACAALGETEAAFADYDAAEQRWPRYPRIHAERALLLARSGRADEAVAAAERALALNPDQPYYAYAARGLARLRQGRREEAARDFAEFERRATRDDPLRHEVARWAAEAGEGR